MKGGGKLTMNQEQVLEASQLIPQEIVKSMLISQEKVLSNPVSYYQKKVYQLCKAEYPGLITMAKYFLDRTKNHNDNHVAVEGVTGCGKSMLTFLMVNIMKEMVGTTFNFKKHILFVPSEGELKKKILNLEMNDVFWLDEAIRALDKHFWYKVDQIEMNQIVKTRRKNYNTIFYNIQRFKELTESFRNHNIQARIYIVNRFAAILFIRDDDKDVDDPWHTKENLSIKYRNWKGQFRYNVLLTQREKMHKEINLPNYFAHSGFPNLEDYPELKEYWEFYETTAREESKKALEKNNLEKEAKGITKHEVKYRGILRQMIHKAKDQGMTWKEFNALTGSNLTGQLFNRLYEYNINIEKVPPPPQTKEEDTLMQ